MATISRPNPKMKNGMPPVMCPTRNEKFPTEESREVAQGQEMVAMMVSCFITPFNRLDTVDTWVSMTPDSRSR